MKDETQQDLYIHRLLNDDQREQLLNELDRGTTPDGPGSRRSSERRQFRQSNLPVTIVHPAGGESWFLAQARNLSETGLAVIHTGYIHAGSVCRVVLQSRNNESISVKGRVVRCRHVEGIIHELGIKYDDPIDVQSFTGCDDPERVKTLIDALTARCLSVLCIAPTRNQARMVTCQIEAARMVIDTMQDFISALIRLRREPTRYDLVIIPSRMDRMDGSFMVSAIRKAGFARPILGVKDSPSEPAPESGVGSIAWLTRETTQEHYLMTLLSLLDGDDGGPNTTATTASRLGHL